MRAQFVLSEVLVGLRRNVTMTIAVVITVAISLALFGTGLLLRAQVNTMKDYWYDKVEVSIFLKNDVSQAQRQQIQEQLSAKPEVQQVYYESKQQAYERFQEQFRDSPALVDNVTPESLPESFRVKLVDPDQFEVISSEFTTKPGVETVVNQRALLDRFFRVLRAVQRGAWGIALVQLVAAAVLISNTVRVAAFSRRRETGIMRLVGASNLYIQMPFLLEGALAGLVGGVFAMVFVALFKSLIIDGVFRESFRFTAFIGWDAVVAITPLVLFIGVILSGVASFVTLRKYLRV